jgi:hypothetical protein
MPTIVHDESTIETNYAMHNKSFQSLRQLDNNAQRVADESLAVIR